MVIFISIQNLFQMVICFCDNHQNLVHMVILFFERPNVPQMVISFLMIITKSTSNSEYFPPSKIFRFGGGGGRSAHNKSIFHAKRCSKKQRKKPSHTLHMVEIGCHVLPSFQVSWHIKSRARVCFLLFFSFFFYNNFL